MLFLSTLAFHTGLLQMFKETLYKYDISAYDSSETRYADLKICYHKVLLHVSRKKYFCKLHFKFKIK